MSRTPGLTVAGRKVKMKPKRANRPTVQAIVGWQDAPTEPGYYFVENDQERVIVHYDEDGMVWASWIATPLGNFGLWKW